MEISNIIDNIPTLLLNNSFAIKKTINKLIKENKILGILTDSSLAPNNLSLGKVNYCLNGLFFYVGSYAFPYVKKILDLF